MTKYQVSPLVGLKSYAAMNALHALLLGFKMIPMYQHLSYEEFFPMIEEKNDAGRETVFREAALLVPLSADQIEAFTAFCKDKNGVPYGSANLKNAGPGEIHEMIVSVCMELSRIKVTLVTEDEKKN